MKNWKMWLRVCLVLLFCTSISTFALAASPGVPIGVPSPYSAMVSTAHPLSSQVGAQILAKGGNAVDAAIAVQFALNVVEPMMSGIGGGGFMMIYLADENKVLIIDSREKAPSARLICSWQMALPWSLRMPFVPEHPSACRVL